MDKETMIWVAPVSLIIYLFIIYEVIKSASRGKKIYKEQLKQTKLLTEMAIKSGVQNEKVQEILEPSQYSEA